MNIEAWLKDLGLGQYAATFRDAAIDADILPDLTDADLDKLGLPLGHRKRLLKAIANLDVTNAAPSSTLAPPTAMADAERRNLAVLFCDLVGSTGIAARLDAEEWREAKNELAG
jgi:class 3 adenylate cyclase